MVNNALLSILCSVMLDRHIKSSHNLWLFCLKTCCLLLRIVPSIMIQRFCWVVWDFRFFLLSLAVHTYILCNGFRGRQQDIAVLGQFSAEVITSSLYPYRKCPCRVMKRISNKVHQKALNHKMFWLFSIKTWESLPDFFMFQSMSILSSPSKRQLEMVSMPLYSLK